MFEHNAGEANPKFRAGFFVEISGLIFNLSDLRSKTSCGQDISDQEVISSGWQIFGMKLPSMIQGEYALRIYDESNKTVILITDPIGSRPIFYTRQKNKCFSSFQPKALLDDTRLKFKKNTDWIMAHLMSMQSIKSSTETAYNELSIVPPASIAIFKDGVLESLTQYENWDIPRSKEEASDSVWVKKHQKLFESAVTRRVKFCDKILAENSGGLDSGSVIAVASLLSSSAISTVGVIRWENEPYWIDLVNDAAKIEDKTITRDLSDIDFWNKFELEYVGYPLSFSPEIPFAELQVAADKGTKIVLSGFGGDEAVTQHGYEFLAESFDRFDFLSLWQCITGHPVKKIVRFVRLLWTRGQYPDQHKAFFKKTLQDGYLIGSQRVDEFIDELDSDVDFNRKAERSLNGSIRKALLFRPFIQNRMRDYTLIGDSLGIHYTWPLLDYDVLQNVLKTPSRQRVGPGLELRYLHKRAMRGIVPDPILDTNTKVMGKLNVAEALFDETQEQVERLGRDTVRNLAAPLDEMIDISKVIEDIDKFSKLAYSDVGSEMLHYWRRMRRLISLNHWCIHGR